MSSFSSFIRWLWHFLTVVFLIYSALWILFRPLPQSSPKELKLEALQLIQIGALQLREVEAQLRKIEALLQLEIEAPEVLELETDTTWGHQE